MLEDLGTSYLFDRVIMLGLESLEGAIHTKGPGAQGSDFLNRLTIVDQRMLASRLMKVFWIERKLSIPVGSGVAAPSCR